MEHDQNGQDDPGYPVRVHPREIYAHTSDAPFDPEGGPMYIRETIRIIDALDLSEEDRGRIYRDNAVEMLGLTLDD